MSTKLLDLKGRLLTDECEVVLDDQALFSLAADGIEFHGFRCVDSDEVRQYNQVSSRKLEVWSDDGDCLGPPPDRFVWNTPEPWASADIEEACREAIGDRGREYHDRLDREMEEIRKREFEPIVRHLMFMVDDFKKRKVVWGVGRGSSCASLVMFLIGLNLVDPIEHDIPMDEFYR